jgi:hypothetical protein
MGLDRIFSMPLIGRDVDEIESTSDDQQKAVVFVVMV